MPVPNSPLSEMEQDRLYQNADDYREQAELLLAKALHWCGRNRVNASGFSKKMLALRERIDYFSRLVADERVFYNLASKSLLENISRLEEFNGAVGKLISGPYYETPASGMGAVEREDSSGTRGNQAAAQEFSIGTAAWEPEKAKVRYQGRLALDLHEEL